MNNEFFYVVWHSANNNNNDKERTKYDVRTEYIVNGIKLVTFYLKFEQYKKLLFNLISYLETK